MQIGTILKSNPYPGRGLVTGLSADGKCAVAAYFIMGRSANSRNRVFVRQADGSVVTAPFDASRVEDPSLIIYTALRASDRTLVVTNGDQTDTIWEYLAANRTSEEALQTRCFEPDKPNFTPRISSVLSFDGAFTYTMSILKSSDAQGSSCNRFFYHYEPLAGEGHFLHTYRCDGNPLPSFEGEPETVEIPADPDAFTRELWESLNGENKISLLVCFRDLATGETVLRIRNKNE